MRAEGVSALTCAICTVCNIGAICVTCFICAIYAISKEIIEDAEVTENDILRCDVAPQFSIMSRYVNFLAQPTWTHWHVPCQPATDLRQLVTKALPHPVGSSWKPALLAKRRHTQCYDLRHVEAASQEGPLKKDQQTERQSRLPVAKLGSARRPWRRTCTAAAEFPFKPTTRGLSKRPSTLKTNAFGSCPRL